MTKNEDTNGTASGGTSRRSPKGPRNRWRVVARWIKRGLLGLFIAAVAGLIIYGLIPKPLEVDMAPVARGEMIVTVDEDGQARVKDRYILSAPLSGRLARIELHAGDPVKQEAVLARLVPLAPPLLDQRSRSTAEARVAAALAAQSQTKAQIARAEAALTFAKQEAKNNRDMADAGALPKQQLERALLNERTAAAELDSARFAKRVAAHELQMARAAMGHMDNRGKAGEDGQRMVITSPVDGRVLKVMQKSEGVVQPGTPLLELGDPQALEIVVDVLTSDAVKIQPGAKVTVDRWGGTPVEARVRMVEPSAFTRLSALGVEEQRVNVVIDLIAPKKQWATLGDGYRVEAHIVVWQSGDAVHVPASAVFRHDDAWAVYRVEGELARLQPVTIGERNGREVQIVEGIEPPAKVVVHPSDRIQDGVAIKAR
jgi:HlyD family secretion protein